MELPKGKAYIRSTIKNEAAAWARYEGNYKSETRALREHDKNTDQRENIRELGIVTRSERIFLVGRPGTRYIPYSLLGCREERMK